MQLSWTILACSVALPALAACGAPPLGETDSAPSDEGQGFTLPDCMLTGCDDRNPCTDDACTIDGCTHDSRASGSVCYEGGAFGYCTARATCDTGAGPECFTNDQCDDGNPCTVDICVAWSLECQNTAANEGSACYVGSCAGTCSAPVWDGQHEYAGMCEGCQ